MDPRRDHCGNKKAEVKLLQFADDTIFFCQPKYSCILAVNTILHSFELSVWVEG